MRKRNLQFDKPASELTPAEVQRVGSDIIARKYCLRGEMLAAWGERHGVDWVKDGKLFAVNDDWAWRDFLHNQPPNMKEMRIQFAQVEIARLEEKMKTLENSSE